MSSPSNLETTGDNIELSDEQVAAYLQAHPDFFNHHLGLLADLQLPHPSGQAVSLIERQVSVLREQNQQYKRKLMELVQIGRDNDGLQQNLHRLTVALMHARNLAEISDVLFDALYGDFKAEVVAIRLRGLPAGFDDFRIQPMADTDAAASHFERQLLHGHIHCGRLSPEQLEYLFQDRTSQAQSTSIIPLGETPASGLLAIGNADPDYYHTGMDTQFLRNLSDLVFCALKPYLVEAPATA